MIFGRYCVLPGHVCPPPVILINITSVLFFPLEYVYFAALQSSFLFLFGITSSDGIVLQPLKPTHILIVSSVEMLLPLFPSLKPTLPPLYLTSLSSVPFISIIDTGRGSEKLSFRFSGIFAQSGAIASILLDSLYAR